MNEDKQIISQRRIRGDTLDRELGIGRKPAWWKRVRGDHLLTMRDKMVRNVQELGSTTGGRVGRREENDMENLP